MPQAVLPAPGRPTIIDAIDAATWSRLTLAPRVVAPADPVVGHGIIAAALTDGALVTAAVQDTTVAGLVVVDRPGGALLALGVAPGWRRHGLARSLLAAERRRHDGSAATAEVSMAERDVVEPLDRAERAAVARTLLEGAGFAVVPPDANLQSIDPMLLAMERPQHGRDA